MLLEAFIKELLDDGTCTACWGGLGAKHRQKAGKALKEKRTSAGITLAKMAESLGVQPSYLCELEHGNRKWGLEFAEAFLSKLPRMSLEDTQYL